MRSLRAVILFVEHVQGSRIQRVLFAVVKYGNGLNCFLLKEPTLPHKPGAPHVAERKLGIDPMDRCEPGLIPLCGIK